MMKCCNISANKEAEARRAAYRMLCGRPQGDSIPLFAQAWWLDTVCPDRWTLLTYPEAGEDTVSPPFPEAVSEAVCPELLAAMPVHTPYGDTVAMPPFTQTTNLWQSSDNKVKNHKLQRILAEQLGRYRYVYLQWPTGQWQAQAFYWKGLDLRLRYTYRMEGLQALRTAGNGTDVETALRADMGRDSRRRLHLAETYGIQVRSCTTEDLCRLYRQTFAAQGRRIPESETGTLARLVDTTIARRQGLLWGGYDTDGGLLSAAFVAWQGDTAYYVAGGSLKRKPPHAHAQTLVLFKAICHCADFCDTFDFEGSMIEGIAQFFRGFGARPFPYLALCGRQPGFWTRAWRKCRRLLKH